MCSEKQTGKSIIYSHPCVPDSFGIILINFYLIFFLCNPIDKKLFVLIFASAST